MTKARQTQFIHAPRGWAWYISRAKAIAEGDLKDVTQDARDAGISWPVAVTAVTWHECVSAGDLNAIETERLRHLLDSLHDALPPPDGEWGHIDFPVTVASLPTGTSRVFHLDAVAGTDDDGKPVITIKFPPETYFWEENLPLAQRIHHALATGKRPDDDGIVACLLETPEHHAALRYAVSVDGLTVEHLAAALWCGCRLQTLISPTNPHRVIFRDMAENDSSC